MRERSKNPTFRRHGHVSRNIIARNGSTINVNGSGNRDGHLILRDGKGGVEARFEFGLRGTVVLELIDGDCGDVMDDTATAAADEEQTQDDDDGHGRDDADDDEGEDEAPEIPSRGSRVGIAPGEVKVGERALIIIIAIRGGGRRGFFFFSKGTETSRQARLARSEGLRGIRV